MSNLALHIYYASSLTTVRNLTTVVIRYVLIAIYHYHYEAYSRGIVMVLLPKGAMFDGVMCFSLFMCSTSLSLRAKALLHTSQTYGFSPVETKRRRYKMIVDVIIKRKENIKTRDLCA